MYLFIKGLVRMGLLLFCRSIIFTDKGLLKRKGPLLLACNHPNSFFDALILGAYFKRPVHFLARGDAFKNPFANRLLTALNAIPIYRLREGREHLALNDLTFQKCIQILEKGGIVLIFSEGLCLNQWQLRPLKKGTARIALAAWSNNSIGDFKVVPVSFNYSSFTRFRKRLILHSGEGILKHEILSDVKNEAEQINTFNRILEQRLIDGLIVDKQSNIVIEFLINNMKLFNKKSSDKILKLKAVQQKFSTPSLTEKITNLMGAKTTSLRLGNMLLNLIVTLILSAPAMLALLIHLPFYSVIKHFIKGKTAGTVFYHSALFGVLIITYPLFIFAIVIITALWLKNFASLFVIMLLPALVMLYLHWRDALERVINYFKISSEERNRLILLSHNIT